MAMGSSMLNQEVFIHSRVHPFVFWLLIQSLMYWLNHSFIDSLIASLAVSFIQSFISIVRPALCAPLILYCHWFRVIASSSQQPKRTSCLFVDASHIYFYMQFLKLPYWRGRALLVNPIEVYYTEIWWNIILYLCHNPYKYLWSTIVIGITKEP